MKKIILWTLGTVSIFFIGISVWALATSGDDLHAPVPASLIIATLSSVMAAFTVVLWCAVYWWRCWWVRYGLYTIVIVLLVAAGIVLVSDYIDERARAHAAAERNERVAVTAEAYIEQMKALHNDPTSIVLLREEFDQALVAQGLYEGLMQPPATYTFHRVHDLYVWLIVDDPRELNRSDIWGYPNKASCQQFKKEFGEALTTEAQAQLWQELCSEKLLEAD